MEEEQTQDKETYFEDMQEDDSIPNINFDGYNLGVPRTRFTNQGWW